MNIEERIKSSVLDEDHLADLLVNNGLENEMIMQRVHELLKAELVELYTYEQDNVVVIKTEQALALVANKDNWNWASKDQYFLSTAESAEGCILYGIN